MFAEELSSNASKKRAAAARARRKQLKEEQLLRREEEEKEKKKQQQQQQQQQAQEETGTEGSVAVGTAASSTILSIPTTKTKPPPPPAPSTTTSSSSNNSVKEALEQRRLRTQSKLRLTSLLKLQSFFRSYISNAHLCTSQANLLDKRFADLRKVTQLLKAAKREGEYVCPPSMVSMLCIQTLFVVRFQRRRRRRDEEEVVVLTRENVERLYKLLSLVILPGFKQQQQQEEEGTTANHVHPLTTWIESPQGKLRLRTLIEVVYACFITPRYNYKKEEEEEVLNTLSSFLKNLLLQCEKKKDKVVLYCRSLLLYQTSSSSDSCGININLLYHLRLLLLKHTGTSTTTTSKKKNDFVILIPPEAERLREASISSKDKHRAHLFFSLVLKSILVESNEVQKEMLLANLVKIVWTVPLFTWKIVLSFSLLLSSSSSCGNSWPLFVKMIQAFTNQHSLQLSSGKIQDLFENVNDVPITQCPAPPLLCLTANLIQMGRFCDAVNASSSTSCSSSGENGGGGFDYDAATIYFNFLSTLLDVIPLGTFGSRHSAVEWVSHNATSSSPNQKNNDSSHYAPIVLSPIILDQCRILLLDSYIRQLFTHAIHGTSSSSSDYNEEAVKAILNTKNDVDLKHEKELRGAGGNVSAASLAAKEAMVDRSKSFWQRSAWAKKISKKVSSLLAGDAPSSSKPNHTITNKKGEGKLMNTSSISRSLAHGKSGYNSIATKAVLAKSSSSSSKDIKDSTTSNDSKLPASSSCHKYNVQFLFALCRTYSVILARWGGGGKEDIVKRCTFSSSSSTSSGGEASAKVEPCVLSLLNVTCFGTNIVPVLWSIIQSDPTVYSDLYSVIDSEKRDVPIRSLHCRPYYISNEYSGGGSGNATITNNENIGAILLFMFVSCLSHTLIVTDDVEIYEMEKPLPLHQIRRCILLLKKLLYRACCVDDTKRIHNKKSVGGGGGGNKEDCKPAASSLTNSTTTNGRSSNNSFDSHSFGLALITASSKTMRDLYDRSSRRPLCVPKLWLVEDLLEKDLRKCKEFQDYTSLLTSTPVLRVCPYLVSFKRRLKLFERIVTTNRILTQGSNETHNLRPGVMVRIMRGRVLEDGLIHLNNLGRNMRQRIVVQYISEAGTKESGVDVGGLFKEFWTDLSNIAFDPNYALFRATEGSGNCLYPNPSSRAAHGSDHIVLFEFLGRILGKALYEGITIQPQFSHFFLSFLRGDYNFLHMLPDLHTMDPQLYNNLMFLKTYEGDATDLCLTFTVANDDFGGNREVPLIPNGADVEVTNLNKQKYIGLVAKHHVCDRVREQSEAFTRGLWEVIDSSWLRLFNEPELQVLISGASDGKIDVADMKSNARYTGGYSGLDKHVHRFWNIFASFSSKHQADLLRFVTSCERPPPLGFSSMNPPFTIQRVGIMRDGRQLPTASTCFNTLKLPTYSSEKVMRERLLYAIESGAGFELT